MFYFETFSDFLAMGRHGFYVWSAYGIALVAMTFMAIAPVRSGKAIRKTIQRQIRRDAVTSQQSREQTMENN